MRLSVPATILFAVLAVPAPARAALDPHLPPDTQMFVAFDLRRVFDSALFKDQVAELANEAIKAVVPLRDALDDLGFEPFKHLDRVTFASPGGNESDRGLFILSGKFDEAKFKAWAGKLKKGEDAVAKVHEVPLGGGAKHSVYEFPLPFIETSTYVALASDKTLLVSAGKDYVVEALKQAKAGKKPVLKNKELGNLLERLDDKSVMSLAIPGKALEGIGLGELLPKDALDSVEAIGGSLAIGDEVQLTLAITAKEEENAKGIRDTADRVLRVGTGVLSLIPGDDPMVKTALDVLKALKVSGKSKVVTLKVTVKAETLKGLFGKD